jgi:hypothetical protein
VNINMKPDLAMKKTIQHSEYIFTFL